MVEHNTAKQNAHAVNRYKKMIKRKVCERSVDHNNQFVVISLHFENLSVK